MDYLQRQELTLNHKVRINTMKNKYNESKLDLETENS